MIKVGVNDNIVITKAEINDKGTLVVGTAELGTEIREAKPTSFMDDMSDGSDTSGQTGTGESNFLMYMPKLTKYEKDDAGNEQVADGKDVMQSFIDLKNQLAHWLKVYMMPSQIKFAPFAGVALNLTDEAAVLAGIVLKANAEKVYANYCNQFIAQVKPFLNMATKPGRLFLHRQSVEKHYGTLRKKFLDSQPFFEPMTIAIQDSKMYTKQSDKTTKLHEAIAVGEGESKVLYVPNFSKYELEKGLDNPERVAAQADTASADAEQEVQNVDTLFSAEDAGDEGFKLED